MTFSSVLLFCCGGIALCAGLVFLVETVVAFCSSERERIVSPRATVQRVEEDEDEYARDLAA